MTTLLPQPDYGHYLLDSQDYWSQLRGQPEPPAPTYRMVDGEMKLGRYVDPYGAQGLMEAQKNLWSRWYTRFLIAAAIPVLFIGVDWVFLFLALPILATWYLVKRNNHRRLYDNYYALLQEISDTGKPVWVPFDKDRLKLIDRRPQAVWP
jgi:hypothetical protein